MSQCSISNDYIFNYDSIYQGKYRSIPQKDTKGCFTIINKNNNYFCLDSIKLSSGYPSWTLDYCNITKFKILYSLDGMNFIEHSTYSFPNNNVWQKTFNLDTIQKIKVLKIVVMSVSYNAEANLNLPTLINPIVLEKFILFQYKSQLYTFDGTNIVLSPSQELDENNFINNGFIDATSITEEQWNTTFLDKSNVKLLMWTDDTSKTDVNLEIEIIPLDQ